MTYFEGLNRYFNAIRDLNTITTENVDKLDADACRMLISAYVRFIDDLMEMVTDAISNFEDDELDEEEAREFNKVIGMSVTLTNTVKVLTKYERDLKGLS